MAGKKEEKPRPVGRKDDGKCNNYEKNPMLSLEDRALCAEIDKIADLSTDINDFLAQSIGAMTRGPSGKTLIDKKHKEFMGRLVDDKGGHHDVLQAYNKVMSEFNTSILPRLTLIRNLNDQLMRLRIFNGGVVPGSTEQAIMEEQMAKLISEVKPMVDETTKTLNRIGPKIQISIERRTGGKYTTRGGADGGCGCGVPSGGSAEEDMMNNFDVMSGGRRRKARRVARVHKAKGGARHVMKGGLMTGMEKKKLDAFLSKGGGGLF